MRKRFFLLAVLIVGVAGVAGAEVDERGMSAAPAIESIRAERVSRPVASASIVCAKGGAIAASVEGGTCTIYAPRDPHGANRGMEAIVCRNKATGDYAWVNCVSGCVGAKGTGRCAASGF